MDFFGDENKKQEENKINWENFDKKYKRSKKRSYTALIVIVLLIVALVGGGFIGYFLAPNVFQNNKMDYVIDTIQSNYYEEYSKEELIDRAAKSLVSSLDDYSKLLTYEELLELYDSTVTDEDEAIGIQISKLNLYEACFIADVSLNSPAYNIGIRPGYQVIEVNGINMEEESAEYVATYCRERRKEGITMKCRIKQADGTFIDRVYNLKGEKFSIQTVGYYIDEGHRNQYVDASIKNAIDEDTAYIRLTQFLNTAEEDFMSAMDLFKESGKNKLILDLRYNPGGSVQILQSIANYFVKPLENKEVGLLCTFKYQDKEEECYTTVKNKGGKLRNGYIEGLEVVVLINEETASAAEVLTHAILEYNENATIVGVKSFGKEIMQSTAPTLIQTEYGGLYLTVAQIFGPVSKRSYHGIGFLPEGDNYVIDKNGDLDFRYYQHLRLDNYALDSQLIRANEVLHKWE